MKLVRTGILAIVLLTLGGLGYGSYYANLWPEGEPDIPNIPPKETVKGYLDYTLLDSDTVEDIFIKRPGEDLKLVDGYTYDPSRYKILRISKDVYVDVPGYRKGEASEANIYFSKNNKRIYLYLDPKNFKFASIVNSNKPEDLKNLVLVSVRGELGNFPMDAFSPDSSEKELISYFKREKRILRVCNFELRQIFPHIFRIYKTGRSSKFDQELQRDQALKYEKCSNVDEAGIIIFDYENNIIGDGNCDFADSKRCALNISNGYSVINYKFELSSLKTFMKINSIVREFVEKASIEKHYPAKEKSNG